MSGTDTLAGTHMASQAVATAMAGPVLMGSSAQLFLAGSVYSSALQARDPKPLRIALIIVLVLLLWCTGTSLADIWTWGVSQERSAKGMETSTVQDALVPLPTMLIGVLVQSIFVSRVMSLFTNRMLRNLWTAYMVCAIAMSFAGGAGAVALSFRYTYGNIERALPLTWSIVLSVWMWCSFIVDVSITITMCILLSSRLAGFNGQTDSALMSLIYLSIESAAPTAVIALAAAIVSVSFPVVEYKTEFIATALWYPLSSLHAMSLFATLSARDRIRRQISAAPTQLSREREKVCNAPSLTVDERSPSSAPQRYRDELRPPMTRSSSSRSDDRRFMTDEERGKAEMSEEDWEETSAPRRGPTSRQRL